MLLYTLGDGKLNRTRTIYVEGNILSPTKVRTIKGLLLATVLLYKQLPPCGRNLKRHSI